MKISVHRQACCSQDDQIGPLEMTLYLHPSSTLQELAETIRDTGFLQFSSTHHTIYGRTSTNELLFSISSDLFGEGRVVHFADRGKTIGKVMADGDITFLFRAN